MRSFKSLSMSLIAGAVFAVLAAPSMAAECPRGDLDKRFYDRNGDLVVILPH